MNQKFYTYSHQTADTNRIFYIGKGSNSLKRASSTRNRNVHWQGIVKKHGFTTEILAYWTSEEEALSHEKLLISCFKDMSYKLANKTDGGEGIVGYKHTDFAKEKISKHSKGNQFAKGNIHTEEWKNNKAKALIGNKFALGKKHSEKTKTEMFKNRTGEKNGMFGKKHSVETKAKIALALSSRTK